MRYRVGLEAISRGELNWLGDIIRLIGFEATYVANATTNGYVNPEIGGRLAGWYCNADGTPIDPVNGDTFATGFACVSDAVSGKDLDLGYFKASAALFQDVPSGKTLTQFVVARQALLLPGGIWTMLPLALIVEDSVGAPISYPGNDASLAIDFKQTAPFVFEA